MYVTEKSHLLEFPQQLDRLLESAIIKIEVSANQIIG